MSRLIVDKLPTGCSECPLRIMLDPYYHAYGFFTECPLRLQHPACLDRFTEPYADMIKIKLYPYYVEFIDPYGVLDGIKIDALNEEDARMRFRRWRKDGQIKDIYLLEE